MGVYTLTHSNSTNYIVILFFYHSVKSKFWHPLLLCLFIYLINLPEVTMSFLLLHPCLPHTLPWPHSHLHVPCQALMVGIKDAILFACLQWATTEWHSLKALCLDENSDPAVHPPGYLLVPSELWFSSWCQPSIDTALILLEYEPRKESLFHVNHVFTGLWTCNPVNFVK